MPGEVEFQIHGGLELERALLDLGPAVANKAGLKALRAGAKPIVDEAKRLVPRRTGALARSITTRAGKQGRASSERTLLIGFRQPVSRIAHLLEFGTSKMAARPFIRPALDARAGEALKEIGRVLGETIKGEALRLTRK